MQKQAELFHEARDFIYRYSDTPFRLASGGESHHYFNCKAITMHPGRLRQLAEIIRDWLLPNAALPVPQAAGGLTLGADPIAFALARAWQDQGQLVMPVVVRKEAKGHGTSQQIEGLLDGVHEVLLLDDVITTGGSSLKAVQALRQAGYIVRHCVCIVDREEGGEANLQSEGITLLPVWKKSDFIA
ncbi:MAG: orotate phosphoribosyltransferase [Leptospiraceae bacterium]|nr:orotate phosphoribosyltransferase [Leptospiraceae bacterium]